MATIDIAITTGWIAATLTSAGAVVARAIPYGIAERFKAATPFPRWSGRRDATHRGTICPQDLSRLAWLLGDIRKGLTPDEQHQVLAVTAPAGATGLPVMVWFHGGAYMAGTGEAAIYDADSLALEGNVVVVSVSYRIGSFGYLPPKGFGDNNVGLRDQILALQWVRDNIAAFGGDPGLVTAFGQSAGADSILALMLSPAADGLFHRAILQSAPLSMRLRVDRAPMAATMQNVLTEALRRNNITPSDATIEQLLQAQKYAAAAVKDQPVQYPAGQMPYGPLDGHTPMVSTADQDARLAAVAPHIDLLIGHTALDAAPFAAMGYGPEDRPDHVPPPVTIADVAFRDAVKKMTAAAFANPQDALVQDWTAAGGRASTYQVAWAPSEAPMGACHCIEIPLLFGKPETWADTYMLGPTDDPIDPALARDARRSWSTFARHGANEIPNHLVIGG